MPAGEPEEARQIELSKKDMPSGRPVKEEKADEKIRSPDYAFIDPGRHRDNP
jgi:hypothetical protein